jgi:hypothetical protein
VWGGHPVCCYKRPLKDEQGLLFWGLYFGLSAWLLAFCFLGLYFGPFDMGSFWKGKELLKGKIAEGKILKGKGKIAEGKKIEGKMLKRG